MRIFACKSFKGHWPVGTAAIITAETADVAAEMLEKELKDIGLHQEICSEQMIEIDASCPSILILNDGDY